MTPERWAQIEDLFHRAAECEPEQRGNLLDDACRNDPDLRREVEVLLSSDRSARDHVKSAVRDGLNAFTFSLAGEVVSHYRILDGLGGGGMGLVYRAEDLKLGRRVAIKFLPEESAKDTAALGRFEREARSTSALEHPNICPIYEFGEHEGQPFLVMQLLEGQTLRDLIPSAGSGKPPLPLYKLLDIAIQIADALEAAHKKGIIHRDIKPANIFVTRESQVKVLDFGLAKLAHADREQADESGLDSRNASSRGTTCETAPSAMADLSLSRTGIAMGTAAYMSPEQVRGEKLDARSDLFSFGLVLYEMATGQRAFAGDTGPLLHAAILNRNPIPLRELNPRVPAALEQIINKALGKNRETRYQAVAEMRADLERIKREIEPTTLPARWMLAFAVVVVLLMVGAIFWFARRQPTPSQVLPDLKLRQLTANSSENPVKAGAISPDGKYLAYSDSKGMHIKLIGSDEAQSIPQPDGLTNSDVNWEIVPLGWFPDSNRFLVNSHPASESLSEWSSETASIWMVSITGGPPRRVRAHAVAWSVSADGALIAFGTNKGQFGEREAWVMDETGERIHKLYESGQTNAICCLYLLPNGRRASYISTDNSGDSIVARDVNGGPVTILLRPSQVKNIGDLTLLPDGRLLYSDLCDWAYAVPDRPCNFWVMRLDMESGTVIQKPRRLTNWVGFWMYGPTATADGKRVAFVRSSSVGVNDIADFDAERTRVVNSRRLTLEETGDESVMDWTSDGNAVIVSLNRGDHYSLRKQAPNSDEQETIVSSAPGLIEMAYVSPDGKWVVAQVRQLPEGVQLMRVPITGGSPELMFTIPEWSSSMCSGRPSNICVLAEQTDNHKQVVFTYFDPVKGRGPELARLDLGAEFETTRMEVLWSISSDGTKLAFAPGPEGPIQIRRLGGRLKLEHVIRTKELGKLRSFVWAANGKGLVIVRTIANARAEVVNLDFQGNAKVFWRCGSDTCFGGPSPDGRHFSVYERRISANMWMMENF